MLRTAPDTQELVMPIYHFKVEDGHPPMTSDAEELKGLPEARSQAVKMMGQITSDASETFFDHPECTMTVTDDADLTLFELHLDGTDSPAAQALKD
jgi:hypothetical protein